MQIYKQLAVHLPSPDRPEEESPQFGSPFVDRPSLCPCGAEFRPIRYAVPGITHSHHLHPQSGGIYCYTEPPPSTPGTPTVLAVGTTVGTAVRTCATIVRASAVHLNYLVVFCAYCGAAPTSGHLLLRAGTCKLYCDTCTDACPPSWLTGWSFRLRSGLLYWTRPVPAPKPTCT